MPDNYYEDDHVVIYHGDCKELLPDLVFDVGVTDPPYGINLKTDYSHLKGSTKTFSPVVGDNKKFDPSFLFALNKPMALFGVDHYMTQQMINGTLHVWDKRENSKPNLFADFETIWTSYTSGPSRMFRYQWLCGVHPNTKNEKSQHPTQKPIPVMKWILEHKKFPEGVILDPFMGSGSTLRAAKDLGRKAIGIEIEEKYCEIAAKRMGQEVLPI